MDKKDSYQYIEFLDEDGNQQREMETDESNMVQIGNEENPELFTPSPASSSLQNDFDVNLESQYIPIFGEEESPNQDLNQQSSSLASSLSIESNHEYADSPIILTNTSRVIRCPVCEKPMRTFYCAKCIQRGNFVTLDSPMAEKFNSTQLRPNEKEQSFDRELDEVDEQAHLEEMLQIKLRTLTRKTEALKSLYNDQKLRLKETENLLKATKIQLDLEKKSNKSKESKIDLIKRFISSRQASVKKRHIATNELIDELKQHVNRRVFQLNADVFPIEEVNLLEHNSASVNMETSPLLTFSAGSYHQIENQTAFSIVEPWLPSNGDYSAYSLWVNDNQDKIPASTSDQLERNPAFRIGAALAYATQLVKNLASHLDVILPAKMEYDVFSRTLLNDPQFSYNVAKLNTNIIHLCVSQGVDVSLLHPHKTLKNLTLLFNLNISDLGRKPIIDVDNEEVACKIESQLINDLSLNQDDFYDFNSSRFADEDDALDSEWEISDTINPMEMQLATEQSMQQNSYISRLPSLRLLTSFWTTGS